MCVFVSLCVCACACACVCRCITICVCASYLHLHSEMLTDWTVSKSDAVLNDSKLLFLHAAIPLPAVFIILAWRLCMCARLCVCVCVSLCVHCFKFDERNLLLKSKSGYLCTRESWTHTHTHTHTRRMTILMLYSHIHMWQYMHPTDSTCIIALVSLN